MNFFIALSISVKLDLSIAINTPIHLFKMDHNEGDILEGGTEPTKSVGDRRSKKGVGGLLSVSGRGGFVWCNYLAI